WLEAVVVGEVRRRDRTPADEPDACRRPLLQDLVAVDGHRDRLHVTALAEDETSRFVWHEAGPAERADLLIGERGVRLNAGHVLPVDAVDDLCVPGAQVRERDIRI